MNTINKIEYSYDAAERIVLPTSKPPFDGSDVLIKLGIGWVEARWMASAPERGFFDDYDLGNCWSCLDGYRLFQADLDDATYWAPLPVEPEPKSSEAHNLRAVCEAVDLARVANAEPYLHQPGSPYFDGADAFEAHLAQRILCEAPRCNCPDRQMVAHGFAECGKK